MATKKTLTLSEAFYVEAHFGKRPAAAIAKDLGVPLSRVQAYIDEMEKAGVEPTKKTGPAEKGGFAVHKQGSVSMTPEASTKGDESRSGEKPLRARIPNGIHVIDKSQPIR